MKKALQVLARMAVPQGMNRIETVAARHEHERPTIPAPAYAACRAAALRAQIAHELLTERETWPAPAAVEWEVES